MPVISNAKKGFTLVELLIVIAILAVLSAAVVVVLNPAELLAQARDSQRLNDFDTLRSAVSIYISQAASPSLGTTCSAATNKGCCNVTGCATPFTGGAGAVVVNTSTAVDGNGWVSVDFGSLTSGSPIARLPLDPTSSTTYYYAYINSGLTFEIDGRLESVKFRDRMTTDGGDKNTCATYTEATCYYEIGNAAGLAL